MSVLSFFKVSKWVSFSWINQVTGIEGFFINTSDNGTKWYLVSYLADKYSLYQSVKAYIFFLSIESTI